MADRTFTEGEAYALVADAVERETAAAKAETAKAQEQVTSISNEKDALELRATAAEEAKATADKELADFKESVETQKAQEAKRTERVAKLAEVAPALKVEGERETRIVAMADETFGEYLESLPARWPQSGRTPSSPKVTSRLSARYAARARATPCTRPPPRRPLLHRRASPLPSEVATWATRRPRSPPSPGCSLRAAPRWPERADHHGE